MFLAGLDIGTTGCKATIYHPDGEYIGRIYHDYPHARTAGKHEVDAGLIWTAVQKILTETAEKYPEIGGIGVTSFGETFVLLDESDQPLRNAMLYTDPRGEKECEWLCELLGRDRVARITGLNPHPMYSIAKLMWIKDHQPEIFLKTKRVCLMEDYIVYLLTGVSQIDFSLASRTMAFDIRKMDWDQDIFAAAGIDSRLFSALVPTGTSAGTIKPELAMMLGISANVVVVSAGHDQVAAAVGSGVFDEGVAVDGAGTVECITPVFKKIPENDKLTKGSYAIVPHVEPDKYVCYAFSYTGGAIGKWFVDNLAGYAAALAGKRGTSIYRQLEGDTPLDAPSGLLVLPHFAGAGTPYMDYGSKGAILGLTLSTTQQEIFCGIMEGVCYEMLLNMRKLSKAGITFHKLKATGGGANSRVWMQMKADVLGIPITALRSSEAGGAGSAMMVGVSMGLYENLRDAAKRLVSERETYHPRPKLHEQYMELYSRYEKLYDAVRQLVK